MRIVPKEIKVHEYRVGLMPAACASWWPADTVPVESGAAAVSASMMPSLRGGRHGPQPRLQRADLRSRSKEAAA
jgi:hypothetical protein